MFGIKIGIGIGIASIFKTGKADSDTDPDTDSDGIGEIFRLRENLLLLIGLHAYKVLSEKACSISYLKNANKTYGHEASSSQVSRRSVSESLSIFKTEKADSDTDPDTDGIGEIFRLRENLLLLIGLHAV